MIGSMKMRNYLLCLLGTLLFLCPAAQSQREVIDRIVAVVGDQVILASELANQMQLAAIQSGQRPQNEAELKELKNEILQQMVSDRLFLIAAKKDTSIVVRDEEIEQSLDDQMARIASNFDNYDAFLDALASEEISLRNLRKKNRPDIENQILKQRYIQRKLYSVSVSKHEVESFFAEFKDSIPAQPEAVRLAHILLAVKPSLAVEDSVKNVATELRHQILDGADFATISANNSSLGAGANGGDLGYVAREDVVDEFARAAFTLNVGDISGVIRTQFGYHVIKCEGKRDNQTHLRHLLLAVFPSADDSARTIALADSILAEVRGGGNFAELAKAYSDDNSSRAQGGELGWFALTQLPPEFAATVVGWTNAGEYRGPVYTKQGLHLLSLEEYQAEKQLSIEADYDQIKQFARQDKTGKIVDEWIVSLKETTYIEYREID